MGLNGEWVKYLHCLGKVHGVDQFIDALIPKVVAEYQKRFVDSFGLKKRELIGNPHKGLELQEYLRETNNELAQILQAVMYLNSNDHRRISHRAENILISDALLLIDHLDLRQNLGDFGL